MLTPEFSTELLETFEQWKKAETKWNKDVRKEVERFKELYLGKPAQVLGNSGWNKGRIWDISLWSTGLGSNLPNVYFFIGPSKKHSKQFMPAEVRILDEQEAAKYEESIKFNERINNRAKAL